MIHTYVFTDGHVITSKLESKELQKRMDRLDWLRVLTEGYTEGEGYSICQKALRAYNKTENFTGIIRLTVSEKDFLYYIFYATHDEKDIDVLRHYIKY